MVSRRGVFNRLIHRFCGSVENAGISADSEAMLTTDIMGSSPEAREDSQIKRQRWIGKPQPVDAMILSLPPSTSFKKSFCLAGNSSVGFITTSESLNINRYLSSAPHTLC